MIEYIYMDDSELDEWVKDLSPTYARYETNTGFGDHIRTAYLDDGEISVEKYVKCVAGHLRFMVGKRIYNKYIKEMYWYVHQEPYGGVIETCLVVELTDSREPIYFMGGGDDPIVNAKAIRDRILEGV